MKDPEVHFFSNSTPVPREILFDTLLKYQSDLITKVIKKSLQLWKKLVVAIVYQRHLLHKA